MNELKKGIQVKHSLFNNKRITFITRLSHDINVPSFCNISTTTRGGKVHIILHPEYASLNS